MSINYSKKIAHDVNNEPQHGLAVPFVALAVNNSENNVASSVITLNSNCTTIEVGAAGLGAAIKWIPVAAAQTSVITAAATANFDNFIPANQVRRFVVPVESQGVSSVVGANAQAGLYQRVAVISVGAASVLTTQY